MTFDPQTALSLATALEEADRTATPGEWTTRYGRFYGDNIYVVESLSEHARVATTSVVEANAESIASLRNHASAAAEQLRAAIGEVAALRAELAELRKEHDQ